MKKFSKLAALVVFTLVCALAIVACPSGGGSGGDGSKTEYYKNESITVASFESKFTDVKTSSGDKVLNPAATGKVYVGIKFEYKNISSDSQTISSLLCFEATYNNEKIDQALYAPSLFGGSLDGSVTAGEVKTGWYVVLLPENWETVSVKFKPELTSSGIALFVAKKTDVSEHLDTATKQTEVAIGETASVNELEMKFSEVKASAEGAAEGKVRVGVKFVVKNTATTTHTLSVLRFVATYEEETVSRVTTSQFGNIINGSNPAGQTLTGWFVVELPENWEKLTVSFTDGAYSDTAIFNINASDVAE